MMMLMLCVVVLASKMRTGSFQVKVKIQRLISDVSKAFFGIIC